MLRVTVDLMTSPVSSCADLGAPSLDRGGSPGHLIPNEIWAGLPSRTTIEELSTSEGLFLANPFLEVTRLVRAPQRAHPVRAVSRPDMICMSEARVGRPSVNDVPAGKNASSFVPSLPRNG